jgi:type VI secretion system secreted protein Hcp
MSDIMILDLGKIAGNCTVTGYAGKIIVDSFSAGSTMPLQVDTANSERTTGRPVISDWNFTKMSDISSTDIESYHLKGTPIPTAILSIGRIEGTSGAYMELMKVTFTNVIISSYHQSGGGGMPSDSFAINFSAITKEYAQQLKDGTKKGVSAYSYDKSTLAAK